MFERRFLSQKILLVGYAARLARCGRIQAARTVLRDRPLGYSARQWSGLIPDRCRTIIDVGAHTGDVSAAFDLAFQPERLLAIEPNPSCLTALRTRFTARRHVQIEGVAVAEQPGVLPFFVQRFDAASSLLPIQQGYLSSLGLPEGGHEIQVPVERLETVARRAAITNVDLLKLDCQGAELRILAGAGELLQHTQLIYTEVWFETVYRGGALFHEVHAFLRAQGFQLALLRADPGIHGHIEQGDALYCRIKA